MTNIEITLKAIVDKAIADLKKAGGAVDDLGDSAKTSGKSTFDFSGAMIGLNQALEVGEKIIRAVGAVHDETVGKFIEYAEQVRDMKRATGESAEESSRLIQAADDVGISYDKLKTSLQMAARQGIDTSVDSLKALSEEYLTLAPGTERMQFLLERFGRSGADMGRLMEMGAGGIEKLNAGIESGLILSDEILKQANANKVLSDTYQDLIAARKIAAGAQLAENESALMMYGMVEERLYSMVAEKEAIDGSNMSHWQAAIFKAQHRDEAEQLVQAMIDERYAAEENAEAIEKLREAEQQATAELNDLSIAQKGFEQTQQSWLASTANETVSALQGLGVSGQEYKKALAAIDEVMGTNEVAEQEHKDAIKNITDEYAKTGNVEDFRAALATLKDTELKDTTDALETTRSKAKELEDQIVRLRDEAAKGIELEINVVGNYDEIPVPGNPR